MTGIYAIPHEILLKFFSHLPQIKDICSVSEVCKDWFHISRDESVPLQHERLDHISFQNLHLFDQFPQKTLNLKLKAFTIFQDHIVGKTASGLLCIHNPKVAETYFLDYTPPYESDLGKFLTSS